MNEQDRGMAGRLVLARNVSESRAVAATPSLIVRAAVILFLLVGAVVTVYPFLFMLSSSFKTQAEMFTLPPNLIPAPPRLEGYRTLLYEKPFLSWALNSVVVLIVRMALSLFLCSLAGFALAKYRFPLRKAMTIFIVASIMIPFEAIYIPLYIFMGSLGWINTYQALIVPFAASGFGIFLMRQFMVTIPDEMIDAARVDGASGFRIYWQIALPLARPAMGAFGTILFLGTWTSFFWPLAILISPSMFTLPVGIRTLLGAINTPQFWEPAMAAAVLMSLPLVVIYLFMQRQFLEGLMLGGIKG